MYYLYVIWRGKMHMKLVNKKLVEKATTLAIK